jgi:hypothetical protein
VFGYKYTLAVQRPESEEGGIVMSVTLVTFQILAPNNVSTQYLTEIPGTFSPSSKGGALCFSSPGSVQHIFSPIGYTLCTLRPDGSWYDVSPTFGLPPPASTVTKIQATYVDVSDEDGTAVFMKYDNGTTARWPVAYIPRSAYVWIRTI